MRMVEKLLNKLLMLNLHIRLVVGFLVATCLTGVIATAVGIWTINRSTMDEVQNRVRQDIHTVTLIYRTTLERIGSLIQFRAERSDLREDLIEGNVLAMESLKGLIRNVPITEAAGDNLYLDMISVVDREGAVLYRATNPDVKGDSLLWDPVVRRCLETGTPQSSTELIPLEKIIWENSSFAQRAAVAIVKMPKAIDPGLNALPEGMVMRVACPIRDRSHKQIGALVGGLLLTRDRAIVDKVKETISQDERYKGREIGVVTIFQAGVRISTNVMTADHRRAIGTTLSKEVYDRVIREGKSWVGRTFVVDDWYITTYSPIRDLDCQVVGILYIGILDPSSWSEKLLRIVRHLHCQDLAFRHYMLITFTERS